jgi:hypothetical protein
MPLAIMAIRHSWYVEDSADSSTYRRIPSRTHSLACSGDPPMQPGRPVQRERYQPHDANEALGHLYKRSKRNALRAASQFADDA